MPNPKHTHSNVQPLFKRPESVLVVVYTIDLDVLIICRKEPANFWQSVTGSLEWEETAQQAAQRELLEETGLTQPVIDHRSARTFAIKGAWRRRYSPTVKDNVEHEFSVQLPHRCNVRLDPAEHVDYCWLPIVEAIARVNSHSNRAALKAIYSAES